MTSTLSNPLLELKDERCIEALGDAYYAPVPAAEFPEHHLRFRNDVLLKETFGLNSKAISDEQFIDAFGRFQGQEPFLALAYHGYQFGTYNPQLGDGRGFLLAQVRGLDHGLYDFGTKGSGRTPFSRTADGCLTLKGGVREIIASEALHYAGVHTSRTVSLIETGEDLWRGDEPSPTRSSVMVRQSRSHIRFGTFERLQRMDRPDLMAKLLEHIITEYYPELAKIETQDERFIQFYRALIQRTAKLVAQWMSVGFCHAVLNTDNMSITGESFDYGPFAYIPTFDPNFTAAYFDYYQRYRYGNQPGMCYWNLEMLQRPLSAIMPTEAMQSALEDYPEFYYEAYRRRMRLKLGLSEDVGGEAENLLGETLALLEKTQVGYSEFFATIRQSFSSLWLIDSGHILNESDLFAKTDSNTQLDNWRSLYHRVLQQYSDTDTPTDIEEQSRSITQRLNIHNPITVPLRPVIEAIWEPIVQKDDWQPLYDFLHKIKTHQ